ncbi:hypothetical protein BC936DRAFT_141070 [Jimgerdemannia flammicorona]|uniref:Uncharacterized protein n=1 Tax=Jimgerdemannia flammicorona TaxID=994334 RepID=A0A433A2Y5_9FUNG|nr:hypothetical protein BC936DRAFT_141070 [Jimgerdemannia flammicorona]
MTFHLTHFLQTTDAHCASHLLKGTTLEGSTCYLTGNAVPQRLLFEYAISHLIDKDQETSKATNSVFSSSNSWVLFIAKDADDMQQSLGEEWDEVGYDEGLRTVTESDSDPGWREKRRWMQRIRMCHSYAHDASGST